MIGYLRGELMDRSEGRGLLWVGGAAGSAGVGYQFNFPQSPSYLNWVPGKSIEVYVHTHAREDALELFGFASKLDKEVFLSLLTVTGIGPKGALGVLSKIEPSQLIPAILDQDKVSLEQVPGIGKKTAERIILELASPVKKKVEAGIWPFGQTSGAVGVSGAGGSSDGTPPESGAVLGVVLKDARDALVGLGYREQDLTPVLKKLLASEKPPSRAEDLILAALQQLR